MYAIIIFGFMIPATAIRVLKPVTGVDFKTAWLACSAKESRLPRVTVNNTGLELVDDIASNISKTFWLDAVYETIQTDSFNGFPHVCCSTFPAFSETCIASCISCNENRAFKCKISQQRLFEGVGPWIRARRLCQPSTWNRGDKDLIYWNQDILRLSINLTSSGQENDTCTYFCSGLVRIRKCSDFSGVDTVCITDKVKNFYPNNTSTVSSQVWTDMGNSSLEYTEGTLSTQSISNTERSTDDSKSIPTQTTGTFNSYVTSMSTQVTTSGITTSNTGNTLNMTAMLTQVIASGITTSNTGNTLNVTSMLAQITTSGITKSSTDNITKDDRYVFITLIVVIAAVLIAFFIVLVMCCRLRKASLKSQRSETNMTDNLSCPDFRLRNPMYGVDHDLVVNGDPVMHAGNPDLDYYTASDVSAVPTITSNIERHLSPGSVEQTQLSGSMNTDTYARPIKVQRARLPSKDVKEEKRENENASGDSDIYALPRKDGKFRKDSNDTERTLNTIDHKTMDPVEDNVSQARLSGTINETSEGEYDMTERSSRTLEKGTSQNIYDTTNFQSSKPLLHAYL